MASVIAAKAYMPSDFGDFEFAVFQDPSTRIEHVLLIYGNILRQSDVLVRVHSECMTGDLFGSLRCDCRSQLLWALHAIRECGAGLLVYLRQEGRGIGLTAKIRAYALQDCGHDTVTANIALGFPADCRTYNAAAAAIHALEIRSIRLLSNNPDKENSLRQLGVTISAVESCPSRVTQHNRRYLDVKRIALHQRIVEQSEPMDCSSINGPSGLA